MEDLRPIVSVYQAVLHLSLLDEMLGSGASFDEWKALVDYTTGSKWVCFPALLRMSHKLHCCFARIKRFVMQFVRYVQNQILQIGTSENVCGSSGPSPTFVFNNYLIIFLYFESCKIISSNISISPFFHLTRIFPCIFALFACRITINWEHFIHFHHSEMNASLLFVLLSLPLIANALNEVSTVIRRATVIN